VKLEPWEPDLRSLRDRIDENSLDLQPDFQRGNVWSQAKQQKLIDSVLRGWAVPPVHLLVLPDRRLAVLDGQQRLSALHTFLKDGFPIGRFEPIDDQVAELRGRRFSKLEPELQRYILDFKISSYRLYEYEPDEPYELFFRLNQPTGLTQAEKRNSLVGEARSEVRHLVEHATAIGWSRESLGFENARLAYDDIIARLCEYLEEGRIDVPMSAGVIEARYRTKAGYSPYTLETAKKSVELVIAGLDQRVQAPSRLNKATLLSWLLAIARSRLDPLLAEVDLNRAFFELEEARTQSNSATAIEDTFPHSSRIASLYSDRSSLRVADTLSVLARDASIWYWAAMREGTALPSASRIGGLVAAVRLATQDPRDPSEGDLLEAYVSVSGWPELS
jgi:hypothetical protein